MGCDKAEQVWEMAGLWENLHVSIQNATDFAIFVFNVITNMQQHKVIDFAMMMWCI